jgi:hypothetical protein
MASDAVAARRSHGRLKEARRHPWTDQKPRSGVGRCLDLVRLGNCSGADASIGKCLGERRHGAHRGGRTQGDLDHRQSTSDQGAGLGKCVLDVLDREHRNDRCPAKHRQGRLAMRVKHGLRPSIDAAFNAG